MHNKIIGRGNRCPACPLNAGLQFALTKVILRRRKPKSCLSEESPNQPGEPT